ncbi:MAG: tetratricopeptide repeat protein [Bacteroidota bacterium]
MNRIHFFLLFWGGITSLWAQDISLQGQISLHNSQYKTGQIQYVDQAYVSADFATASQSNGQGEFSILFRGLPTGSAVQLLVEKEGLEIVNLEELQEVVIPRRKNLRIFMAPIGSLEKARQDLYNINLDAINRRYQRYIARLKTDQETALADLEADMGRKIADRWEAERLLEQRLAATQSRLPEVNKELVRVNLDFAAEYYRRAYEAYKRGALDTVILILEEEDINAKKDLSQWDKLQQARADLDSAIATAQALMQQKIQALGLLARTYEINFEPQKEMEVYKRMESYYRGMRADSLELSLVYTRMADVHVYTAQYDSALSYAELALSIRKKRLGKTHARTFQSFHQVGQILFQMGQGEASKKVSREPFLLAMAGKVDSASAANIIAHYGGLMQIERKLDSALWLKKMALAIRKHLYKRPAKIIANALTNLAVTYWSKGKRDSAISHQKQAIEIFSTHYPPDHHAFGFSYLMLTRYFLASKQLDSAKKYNQLCREILLKKYAPLHPHIGSAYRDAGYIYKVERKFEQSKVFYFKAKRVYEQGDYQDKSYLAAAHDGLGKLYREMGKYDSALYHLKQSLPLYLLTLSPKNPMVASLYHDMAFVYRKLDSLDVSTAYFQKVVYIYQQTLGATFRGVGDLYLEIGHNHYLAQNLDSAMVYVENCLSNYQQQSRLSPRKMKRAKEAARNTYEKWLAATHIKKKRSHIKAVRKRLEELEDL